MSRMWNWKGGRTMATQGYVLIWVGRTHHLADRRGYAYEHRIEAEKKLGRRLIPGEQVHHVDGNKSNNIASNLEVVAGNAEHKLKHRTVQRAEDLRLPCQPNPVIECACGCGREFHKFDPVGRARKYLTGHNSTDKFRKERDVR